MPYIGKNPVGGGFHKLDSLTASATDTYALTLGSAAYYPESANQLLVSLNGVIQAPQDSFTVSGSDLVFDDPLTGSDSIDFVVALGDVLAVKTVTDGAITTAKLGNGAVTDAKIDTMAASKLTGALPALNGSALTNIGGALTAVSEQTASGSSTVDFTGIPSGVELVKFTSWGLSSNATATIDIRIGDSGGFETTGYARQSHYGTNALVTGGSSLSGDSWRNYAWVNAVSVFYFSGQLVHAGSNRWIMDASIFVSDYDGYFVTMMGYKELSGELDRIQFFPTAGTFDAGTIRIMYA
jgi:hypothetical protein